MKYLLAFGTILVAIWMVGQGIIGLNQFKNNSIDGIIIVFGIITFIAGVRMMAAK